MTTCLMEEIAEERAPPALHQGKRAVVADDEAVDDDLRARITTYAQQDEDDTDALYKDEFDDSFLVHADLAMEKMGIDEAEDLSKRASEQDESKSEEPSKEAAARASSGGKPNPKHQLEKNKASRGRRKQANMKKSGIMNVVGK